MTLEWIGLLGSLALLIVLTMRGVDLLLAAPVCALLLALSFGLPLLCRSMAGIRSCAAPSANLKLAGTPSPNT